MHSLNLNCATQGEQLKNCFENSVGEFLGRVMRRNSVLVEQWERLTWESRLGEQQGIQISCKIFIFDQIIIKLCILDTI